MSEGPYGRKGVMQGKVFIADAGANPTTDSYGNNNIELEDIGDFSMTLPDHVVDVSDGNTSRFASIEDTMERGRFVESRMGPEQPITFKFSYNLRGFTDGSVAIYQCVLDIAHYNASRSVNPSYIDTNWIPVNGLGKEVSEWNLIFVLDGQSHDEGKDHKIWLSKVQLHVEQIAEGSPNDTASVSGRAWRYVRT